jgi:hypothetical protein
MQRSVLPILALALAAALSTAACGDEPLACVEVDTATCTPQYPPTYNNVFQFTLRPGCGVTGASCHSGQAAQAGLILDDADHAYAALMQRDRVIPGDPGCSTVVIRAATEDESLLMPPGARMPDEEVCAIAQWIEGGAER